jgi:hypothetical protein
VIRHASLAAAALLVSCAPPAPPPLPPNTFAFAVFGDGPYRLSEEARFASLLDDVNRTDVEWFVHIGDLMDTRCSDAALASRLEALNTIGHPVIYTPGDNEWTDCHRRGGLRPLERLQRIRTTYFADPTRSTAGAAMSVESQSRNPAWKEVVENARWVRGGFLFATVHMVGSWNAKRPFPGRTSADDSAVVRRTAAGLDWLDSAFAIAGKNSLSGVVIAIHGDPHFERTTDDPYASFLARLEQHTSAFPGQVLLIHGDTHKYRVDHPLTRARTGEVLANFTRQRTANCC